MKKTKILKVNSLIVTTFLLVFNVQAENQSSTALVEEISYIDTLSIQGNARDAIPTYVNEITLKDGSKSYAVSFYSRTLRNNSEQDIFVTVGKTYPEVIKAVREELRLSEDAQVFSLQKLTEKSSLITISGEVKKCTKFHNSGVGSGSFETVCVSNYMIDNLKGHIGQTVSATIQPGDIGNAPCDFFTALRHRKGCNLKYTNFLAEVKKDGKTIVKNFDTKFKID